MRIRIVLLFAAVALLLGGCSDLFLARDKTGMVRDYAQITQEEAKRMMAEEEGYVILDVRRPDEYAEGHIPGAVCLPNEEIGTEPPALLSDREQIILVYCRTGRRAGDAAKKLADMGYTNVYNFGGINKWDGETETGE